MQLVFDKNSDALCLVSFYSNVENIKIGNREIFWDNTKEIYEELAQRDPTARKTVGITVFFKFGISVAGFLGNDDTQKSLTVFAKDQWKPSDPALQPI